MEQGRQSVVLNWMSQEISNEAKMDIDGQRFLVLRPTPRQEWYIGMKEEWNNNMEHVFEKMMLIIHQLVWPWLWLIWFDCLIYNVHRWRLSLASALLASGTISSSPNLQTSIHQLSQQWTWQPRSMSISLSIVKPQVPSHLSGSLFHPRWSRQFGRLKV